MTKSAFVEKACKNSRTELPSLPFTYSCQKKVYASLEP